MLDVRTSGVQFSILGPLQVQAGGRQLDPGPRKQQIVLAILLCHANSAVSVDSLVDALWEDSPPRTARKNIQVYVSTLRGLLASAGQRISHLNGGYIIQAEPAELDSLRFEHQVEASQKLWKGDQPSAVAGDLASALNMWRGPALDGMREIPLIEAAVARLDRRYLAAFEDWAEAELAAGGALGAIERIADMAIRHPFRERLRVLQMTALGQAGRRSEALAVFDELRQSLAHELGLAPSGPVRQLYQSLLRDEEPATAARPLRRPTARCVLPRSLPTFSGREKSSSFLQDGLTPGGLALLTGPVGVGKTALAVHTAHALSDSFPDGCFFVRMRESDGAALEPTAACADLVAEVMRPEWPVPPGEDTQTWQDWVADHRVLVVLDDAVSAAQVRPLVPRSGDSAVIVTARSQLAWLETAVRLQVPPFGMTEALDALGRIIGTGRIASDRAAAERIVTATGFLPLAVRILADRLTLLRHVPLREYLQRLSSGTAVLDELTTGDVAMRTCLAASVDDLTDTSKAAFVRLGLLPQAIFTLREAAAVLETDADTATRTLESLLEASILGAPEQEVVAHDVLFEMPALTHAYSRELAAGNPVSPPGSSQPQLVAGHLCSSLGPGAAHWCGR